MTDPTRISDDQHNNASAVPQGWPPFDELDDDLIDAACTAGSLLYRVDLMRAYECIRAAMLAATPAPAPAQEVGLTDEEIEDVFEQHKGTAGKELRATIGRAIIAALREKE